MWVHYTFFTKIFNYLSLVDSGSVSTAQGTAGVIGGVLGTIIVLISLTLLLLLIIALVVRRRKNQHNMENSDQGVF